MKISCEWLKEYVDIRLSPEELAERLTMLGFESSVEGRVGEQQVLEVEITANRPDCLSIIGLAREISALTGKNLVTPEVKLVEDSGKVDEIVSVEISTELCSRYCGRVISGVKVGPSPDWVRKKIEAVGFRPVNNVVDITNYVLLELGHPLHAFDYDCLEGHKIIVRCARQGETLVTLDEIEKKLEPSVLVIADERRPVAVAGIMGGLQTEVTDRTKTVLLESAYFDASSVRRTSKRLQMETEASYRFQRGADIEATVSSIDRTAQLIQELAEGRIAKGIVDCYPHKYKEKKVCLRLSRLNQVLGVRLSSDYVGRQLESLGFEKTEENGKFMVNIPSFRRDIHREIDLIEEIARHYGYDKISVTIPAGRIPSVSEDKSAEAVESARRTLAASGLTEVITHGFVSERWTNLFSSCEGPLRVKNPLSEEQSVMRTSLLPGLLKTLSVNLNRGVENVRVFELGNVFYSGGKLPEERMSVGAAITGSKIGDWRERREEVDFYNLKGVLENLLQSFRIAEWNLAPYEGKPFTTAESAGVRIADSQVGVIGEMDEEVRELFGIEKAVYVFELNFELLLSHVVSETKFKPLPRFPASFRDIAIVVPEEVMSADITSAVMDERRGIVEKVELFDLYRGEQVPEGYKSMAYSIIYRASDRTLTEDEVNKLHGKISRKLVSQFKGRIR